MEVRKFHRCLPRTPSGLWAAGMCLSALALPRRRRAGVGGGGQDEPDLSIRISSPCHRPPHPVPGRPDPGEGEGRVWPESLCRAAVPASPPIPRYGGQTDAEQGESAGFGN